MSENHTALLRDIAGQAYVYPSNEFAGRGIVICAGGMCYLPCAWVCINMLRKLGCKLPVEVWHLGESELPPEIREFFTPLDVEFVDAHAVRLKNPARTLNGWELKVYSVIHSRFREVLSLDADNVPTVDPTFLFDTEQYRELGAIFWPDYGRLGPERSIWELMELVYRDEREVESGQVVVDKARCWHALAVAMHLNEHSDFYYSHIHGDKETFHLAWRKIGQEYAMPPHDIFSLAGTMCQHDFDGRVIFQHRNMLKWSLNGNQRVRGFRYEEECLTFLDDFKRRRRAAELAKLTPEQLSLYDSVIAQRSFHYTRVGYDDRPLELLEGFQVGFGRALHEQHWTVTDSGGRVALILSGGDGTTCVLADDGQLRFSGAWLIHERMPILLRPSG